ncbi:VWA domain-containing protein [Alloacidobacterium dinghuense]|uniref:VWA domain-containing protein n=1 Tax=Alloacidobacterium dinghuense TaxID=2763107 RepID=A0A7G8BJN7_9BACT|nr:VWA domain-containing protein [Alloacidobacterium dinghuense]QNI32757.1 VWA domain-containing protein [Alloacidobacterium dinghuense]
MRLRILQQLVLLALPLTLNIHAQNSQPYTLRTQSNVVLVPTTVQTKHGELIYELKPEQFVVEDNGVPQTIRVDEDTGSLGLTMVVLVQCSRSAVMESAHIAGLATMIDSIAGGAPHQIAVVSYGENPTLLGNFSSDTAVTADALAQLTPCDDSAAATFDAVAYATKLLEARDDHNRHVILLVSETRDHDSKTKAAEVIAALGRTNTVVNSVAFSPGKTEILNDLHYGEGSGPFGLLVMAVSALKKNVSHELAALSGGEYINFTTRNGFDAGMLQLTNHIHNYYLLSFQPKSGPDGNPSPGMHSIRVSVPDYPSARLRFRESYFSGALDTVPPEAQ